MHSTARNESSPGYHTCVYGQPGQSGPFQKPVLYELNNKHIVQHVLQRGNSMSHHPVGSYTSPLCCRNGVNTMLQTCTPPYCCFLTIQGCAGEPSQTRYIAGAVTCPERCTAVGAGLAEGLVWRAFSTLHTTRVHVIQGDKTKRTSVNPQHTTCPALTQQARLPCNATAFRDLAKTHVPCK